MRLTREQLRGIINEEIKVISEMTASDGALHIAHQLYDVVSERINASISALEEDGEWERADELEAGFDDAVLSTVSDLMRQVMPQRIDMKSMMGHRS